jgi:hypothetical protein
MNLSTHFNISMERRPCLVNGRKAMFHGWHHEYFVIEPSIMVGGHPGGQMSKLWAIVEDENGTCGLFEPHCIRFIDHSEFEQFAWPKEKLE